MTTGKLNKTPRTIAELEPAMQDAFARNRAERASQREALRGQPRASEMLAENAEVPFSFRIGAQERKLLVALAKLEQKNMSQFAREILAEGLAMRQVRHGLATTGGDKASALESLREPTELLAMLASSLAEQLKSLGDSERDAGLGGVE